MAGLPTQAGPQIPLSPVTFDPVFQSQQPRFVVKIDNNPYIGESYSFTSNAHGATDTGTVVLPINGSANFAGIMGGGLSSAYPDWTASIQRSVEAGNAAQPVVIEIWAGYPTNPATFGPSSLGGLGLRFRGIVDQYNPVVEDNKTTFACRSLGFPLTSTKISVPFPDESTVTTVAFIQQQAANFGLTVAPPLLGQAPAKMIDVLGGAFIHTVRGMYLWDLFLLCAQFDDVDIWVDKTGVLNYAAPSLVQRQKIYYQWGQNCKGISATHSPQFSKNVRVQVHSWTARTRTTSTTRVTTDPDTGGITTSSSTRVVTSTPIFGTTSSIITSISSNGTVTTSEGSVTGGGSGGSTGSESESGQEKYTFFVKNKTLAQCQIMAQQLWRQISMHEYSVKISAPVTPGNLPLMDVTASIILSGHPMTWFNSVQNDGTGGTLLLSGGYWPRAITESFDVKSGWHWDTIDCVNHPLAQNAV